MKNPFAKTLCAIWVLGYGPAFAEDIWISPALRAVRPTVAIRITWVDKDKQPQVSRGTAFLISRRGHYLTAAHVIPEGVPPDQLLIEAELRPYMESRVGPTTMTLVGTPDRSDLIDAAVIQDSQNAIRGVPLIPEARLPKPPEELLIIGYAGESASEINIDRVAGEGANGSVKMHAFVKEGFSGSPVIDKTGRVVGMVRGGDPVADIRSNSGVMGKALFVPVSRILAKMRSIAGISWTDPSSQHSSSGSRWVRVCDPVRNTCALQQSLQSTVMRPVRHTQSIDTTKDDHPVLLAPSTRTYEPVVFNAFPGYRITDASFEAFSANGAKHDIVVAGDGKSATFTYALTSGPMVDRYRGWIKGNFVITMLPLPRR